MSIKKDTTAAATKAKVAKVAQPELKSEDRLEIQQQILESYSFDIEQATQQALESIKNELLINFDNGLRSLDEYKELALRPIRFNLNRYNFSGDDQYLATIIEFSKAGFELCDDEFSAYKPVALMGKDASTMKVVLKAPEKLLNTEAELLEQSQAIAEEMATAAREEFFTLDNITELVEKQLEENRAYNLKVQQEALSARFEANILGAM
ncbi:hypothetical protein QTN94_14305 [Vibrio sp. M250220]|uniref:hypothetical protein n=1 Tax=Vibrio sp. M250220 TaxID=3020894 RepID=UPI002F3FDC66